MSGKKAFGSSARFRSRVAFLLILASCSLFAIQPEPGLYVPGETLQGDPAKLIHLEVQERVVQLTIITFDSESGLPEVYRSEGQLRDDAINPGQTDAPLITAGYYPLHAYVGDLERIEGGRCLTCVNAPIAWRREVVGRVEAYFPNAEYALVEVRYLSQHRPAGVPGSQVIPVQRMSAGRDRVLLGNSVPNGPPSIVGNDLRGQWVFVDQADAGAPVRDEMVRYEFTEQVLSPQPFVGPSYMVTYRDPVRDAELRCTSVGTAIGQKAAGCELHSQGRVLFSARREDIGMDRIQAFRGELPTIVALVPTVTNPYRKPGQVIGLRVSMPPPGPLGPSAAPSPNGATHELHGSAETRAARSDGRSAPLGQQR